MAKNAAVSEKLSELDLALLEWARSRSGEFKVIFNCDPLPLTEIGQREVDEKLAVLARNLNGCCKEQNHANFIVTSLHDRDFVFPKDLMAACQSQITANRNVLSSKNAFWEASVLARSFGYNVRENWGDYLR